MSDNTVAFCGQLTRHFPELASLLQEHIADYDEILPHVFMADVARYVLTEERGRVQIVSHLDGSLRDQGNDIQNLIAVSFVENLATNEDLERALTGVEASALRNEWSRQHIT